MGTAVFLLLLAAAALAGYGVLVRLGLDDAPAWAAGRACGLIVTALPAWWYGAIGLPGWRVVGAAVLAAAALVGGWQLVRRRPRWRSLALPEAFFWLGTGLVLVMRLDHPAILQTEKLMDLGIAATLLRTPGFPPPDMWLAGHALPYYYWGALQWTLPLGLSGVGLAVGYNLVAAAMGGLVAAGAWALAAELSGSVRSGLFGAVLATFAGTPDGLRQLLAGAGPGHLDLWASSRQVSGAITEFPLFTLWLGDLHPHLLAIPPALLAMLVALVAGRRGPRVASVAALAGLVGVTWAANPWALPPTATAVLLLLVAGDGRWRWPWRKDGRRWLLALPLLGGAFAVSAPFQLAFHPPLHGLGVVHTATRLPELLLYAGGLLLPLAAIAAAWLVHGVGAGERARATALGAAACVMLAAVAAERPVLVLLGVALALLAAEASRPGVLADRPGILLAGVGVFLLLVPEVIFVRDPYGADLYRMNTVFKAYLQAWLLLAVAAPVLLARLEGRVLRRAAGVVMVVLAAPHLVGVTLSGVRGAVWDLDGLRWMSDGDRAAVATLEREPAGTVLLEAVGDAYTEHARLSAASGVPAYLGWANHEGVWRGAAIDGELARREEMVRRIYTCGDPTEVARLMRAERIDLAAVGDLERADYPADGLAAVRAAGEVVVDRGTVLVRVTRGGGA